MKCKQLWVEFELRSLCPFPKAITIIPCTLTYYPADSLHLSSFRVFFLFNLVIWKDLFQLMLLYYHLILLRLIIGLMSKVFANSLGDWGSIPSRVLPKTQKMVLDAVLLNAQHYKVRIKGKLEQSREWSSTLPYSLV